MSRSDFSVLTELVPQISFDIIGRITPAMVVIFSLTVTALGPIQAFTHIDAWIIHPDPPLSGWAVVLFIVVAYILAIILSGIWNFQDLFRRPSYKGYKPDLKDPSVSLQYDAVRLESPKAGARNTKLSAEMSQAEVLIVGWFISAAINLYFLIAAFSLERLWLEMILVVGIVGAFSFRKHIYGQQRLSLSNHWLILQCDQLPTSTGHTTLDKAQ